MVTPNSNRLIALIEYFYLFFLVRSWFNCNVEDARTFEGTTRGTRGRSSFHPSEEEASSKGGLVLQLWRRRITVTISREVMEEANDQGKCKSENGGLKGE